MKFHRGELIEFIYLDENERLSQRHVRVIFVDGSRMIAYCYLRRQLRSFSMDRILSHRKYETKKESKAAI